MSARVALPPAYPSRVSLQGGTKAKRKPRERKEQDEHTAIKRRRGGGGGQGDSRGPYL